MRDPMRKRHRDMGGTAVTNQDLAKLIMRCGMWAERLQPAFSTFPVWLHYNIAWDAGGGLVLQGAGKGGESAAPLN